VMAHENDRVLRRTAGKDHVPLPADKHTLFAHSVFFFQIWALKLYVAIVVTYHRAFRSSSKTSPTITRYYASRPSLQVRIFLPKTSKIENKYLPLYIDIHGGGFVLGSAALDDYFCSSWCERTGMIVASLNYRKSPLHPFPTPVHDIAVLSLSVIEDKSLPIDKSRVIIGGFSAGGNLALTSSLLPELQRRIKGVVAYYPVVDWSSPPHTKFATRLYTERASESLATAGAMLDWAYVTAGQNRKTKILSPCYADRKELPEYICMIGAQHDMFCREARDMMYSLAGKELPETGWDGFEEGTYKWVLKMGVRHAFMEGLQLSERRKQIIDETSESVHRWLVDKVFQVDTAL
jgi:acetyl esterase/lipase